MAKKNMKVDLERYMSPEEKIKRSFIFSCTILVILTFLIFITYSFFINNTGEIDVGDTYAAIPDVEIIDNQIVDNTNNQQAIYTIKNNSNTNTYSYNLVYNNVTDGAVGSAELYYKIPDVEYSHPEGIIKPNEEKKIYLVSGRIQDGHEFTEIYNIKINSGYEYTPIIENDEYKKLKYSPLSETTELIDLSPSFGTLEPLFDPEITDYNLLYEDYEIATYIDFTPSFYGDSGYLSKYSFRFSTNKNYNISVYAEDGTYINTYNISAVHTVPGKIKKFRIYDECSNKDIAEAYNENGFENNDIINFKLPSEIDATACGSLNSINWNLYFELMSGYYTQYDVEFFGYNPGYHQYLLRDASSGKYDYVTFANGAPESELMYISNSYIKVYKNGTDDLLITYNISLK